MEFNLEIKKHVRCKNPNIKIKDSNTVTVVLPCNFSKKTAHHLVEKNREWILNTLSKVKEKEARTKSFFQGNSDKVLFFGEWLDLEVDPAQKRRYVFEKNSLIVKDEKHIDSFYKETGREFFMVNSALFAKKLGKEFGKITIRKQKTLWGSCNCRGDLSYNLKLIKAPKFVGEYVCAHEVCHLIERNHSKAFYALVDSVINRRKEAQRWLKENGAILSF